MVCLMCLIPLFLIPVVNALPLLLDVIMAKIYGLFGWEYRKPERVPPSCPYKPSGAGSGAAAVNSNDKKVEADGGPAQSESGPHQLGLGDKKSD